MLCLAGATKFSEGNAVLALPKNLTYDGSDAEFFAPSDWLRLDDVVRVPLTRVSRFLAGDVSFFAPPQWAASGQRGMTPPELRPQSLRSVVCFFAPPQLAAH